MKAWKDSSVLLRMLLYGDPGSGKTTFIGTAMDDPRTYPLLYLNCGGNPESIRKRNPMPVVLTVDDVKDLNAIYDWLNAGQPEKHPFVEAVKKLDEDLLRLGKFKTLAFDGLTEFQRIVMDGVVGNKAQGPGDSLAQPQIQHWGQGLQRMVYVARLFFALPLHVIITSLEAEKQDGITQVISSKPALWGQSATEIPAYSLATARFVRRSKLSNIQRKDVSDDTYTIAFFDQAGRFLAKDQYGSLPKSIEDPTLKQVLDAIYPKLVVSPEVVKAIIERGVADIKEATTEHIITTNSPVSTG